MSQSTVVLVVGASGGVGTSVLSAAISVRGRQAGVDVVAVDLRPLGGGLDVTFGAEQEPGVRWSDLVRLSGAADATAILARLPRVEGVPVLAFGRGDEELPEAGVVREVVGALAGSGRLVVVDASSDGPFTESTLGLATQVVLVAGSELRQLAALAVVARWLSSYPVEVVVCLRGDRRVPELAPLVESAMGLTVIGYLTEDRSLAGDLVHGVAPGSRGRGPLVEIADECLAQVLADVREGAA